MLDCMSWTCVPAYSRLSSGPRLSELNRVSGVAVSPNAPFSLSCFPRSPALVLRQNSFPHYIDARSDYIPQHSTTHRRFRKVRLRGCVASVYEPSSCRGACRDCLELDLWWLGFQSQTLFLLSLHCCRGFRGDSWSWMCTVRVLLIPKVSKWLSIEEKNLNFLMPETISKCIFGSLCYLWVCMFVLIWVNIRLEPSLKGLIHAFSAILHF